MPEVHIIPFSCGTAETEAFVLAYLATKAYLPSEFLAKENKVNNVTGFAPAYLFQVKWSVNWAASFGYDRREHYTTYETEIVNNVRRQQAVNHTRTVTDWHPSSGREDGEAQFLAYGGSILPVNAVSIIETMNTGSAVLADSEQLSIPVEPYDHSAREVWNESVHGRADSCIDQAVRSWAQGDHQRNWTWHGSTEYSVIDILCPFEGMEIKFNDQLYTIWVDGSDTSRIRHDDLPVDSKVLTSIVVGFLPGVALFFLAFILWLGEYASTSTVAITFFASLAAIIVGMLRKWIVEDSSRQSLSKSVISRNAK